MTPNVAHASLKSRFRPLSNLLAAEWAAGIIGLRLFIACVTIAAFMMGSVWIVGGGLSTMLQRGGTTFLGGDVAVTTNFPLPADIESQLVSLGDFAKVVEFRSSAKVGDRRTAIEVKGVDRAYPLYGDVTLASGRGIETVLADDSAPLSVVVEETLLTRTGARIGDTLTIGDTSFEIADILTLEPDRLSAGRFMVGPRVLMNLDAAFDSNLIQRGSIVEYRYRIRAEDRTTEQLIADVRRLEPETGWEFETPSDAGDRVLRTVERTTTFLGIAGIISFMIGLSGAWSAAKAWVQRRSRTIALYRLSGATPEIVLALHAVILLMASAAGLIIGLGMSLAIALPMLDMITTRLNVGWHFSDMWGQISVVTALLALGLIGTGCLALSNVANVSPGAAMRSGDAPLQTDNKHALASGALIFAAIAGAVLSLPSTMLAGLTTAGFLFVMGALVFTSLALSRYIAGLKPRSFFGVVISQSLSNAEQTATRAVAIGIGIIGITVIVAAQSSLNRALTNELPERVPDLVLIDVQPQQVDMIAERIEGDQNLGGLQANPFMRMTITEVNGVPAEQALVREDKSWVIEGDRSFSWTAARTGAELLQGAWWDEDYSGPPLVSPEEDLMEAFDLTVGDTLTYSVLGRTFTSEVANIRKEYHRTFRPEYLLMASPQPFKNAPHTWVMSLQGNTDTALNDLIRSLSDDHPNITSIDIRPIVSQVRGVVEGATMATVILAVLLIVAGALSVAALVASDVDARRREAIVFSLIGATRQEVAMTRFAEAAIVGAISAIMGGIGGIVGGFFIVTEGLHVAWAPSVNVFLIPFALGIAASVVAGLVGGIGSVPKGRGQMVKQLAA